MTVHIVRGDARRLPLADGTVDLIVTSPPYWSLRSYTDGGEHYDGQIGAEDTPAEFIDNLIACTREWVRVLKPTGSLWVNLGDKYAQNVERSRNGEGARQTEQAGGLTGAKSYLGGTVELGRRDNGVRTKSLVGLPWRYALRCIDTTAGVPVNVVRQILGDVEAGLMTFADARTLVAEYDHGGGNAGLGLILRAEVIWSKPNGLPESVTDRTRRSHEQWFHLVKEPRYYSAIDHIRTPYQPATIGRNQYARPVSGPSRAAGANVTDRAAGHDANPLGALPGSVWEIPTEPLQVPAHLGIDHYACLDTETEILTRRGWLRHDEVKAGDECGGYDLDAGTARWTQVHAVHSYDYNGELIAVDKRDLSMRLTPNHRTIVQKRHGRAGHRGPVEVVRADELTPHHFIPRSAEWEEPAATKSIGVDLAALCGWIAAEGWYQGRLAYLCQSTTANPEHVDTIRNLINRVAGTYDLALVAHAPEHLSKREWRGRPSNSITWRLPYGLGAEVQRLMPDKRLTWDFLELPEDERRALLEAFIAGDGHTRISDGRMSIYQHKRNTVTVDVLQAIAVTLGYKTTRTDDGGRWVLYLTTGGRAVTLRGTNGSLNPVPREHYKGIVWCPTTGTGTFVARRNGRVFITGNSYPTALIKPIILGWSPSGICTACGEGRRPLVSSLREVNRSGKAEARIHAAGGAISGGTKNSTLGDARGIPSAVITGEVCGCPDTTAPTRPALVLDPFSGTGTTSLVAHALGRTGIGVDMSADYCRLAAWRTSDPGQIAKVLGVAKPPVQLAGQTDLLAELDGGAA